MRKAIGFILLDRRVVDTLNDLRQSHEGLSDVILRVVADR
jgi:hypothetical protein